MISNRYTRFDPDRIKAQQGLSANVVQHLVTGASHLVHQSGRHRINICHGGFAHNLEADEDYVRIVGIPVPWSVRPDGTPFEPALRVRAYGDTGHETHTFHLRATLQPMRDEPDSSGDSAFWMVDSDDSGDEPVWMINDHTSGVTSNWIRMQTRMGRHRLRGADMLMLRLDLWGRADDAPVQAQISGLQLREYGGQISG